MIKAVGGPDHAPAFMGLGGVSPDWVPPFLNRSNHSLPAPPIDYISVHHYASCSNRTDPSTYSAGFFGNFAAWMKSFKETVMATRDASSFPKVGVYENRGPHYRSPKSRLPLIKRTPQQGTPKFRKP